MAIIEDFEAADPLAAYNGETTSGYSIVSSPVKDGGQALQLDANVAGTQIIGTDSLDVLPAPGTEFDIYVYLGSGSFPEGIVMFGMPNVTSEATMLDRCYYINIEDDTNDFEFWRRGTASTTDDVTLLATTHINYSQTLWYRLNVVWDDGTLGGSAGDITITLYDDEDTEVGTLGTVNDTEHTGESLGFWNGGDSQAPVVFDAIQTAGGGPQSATATAGTLSATAPAMTPTPGGVTTTAAGAASALGVSAPTPSPGATTPTASAAAATVSAPSVTSAPESVFATPSAAAFTPAAPALAATPGGTTTMVVVAAASVSGSNPAATPEGLTAQAASAGGLVSATGPAVTPGSVTGQCDSAVLLASITDPAATPGGVTSTTAPAGVSLGASGLDALSAFTVSPPSAGFSVGASALSATPGAVSTTADSAGFDAGSGTFGIIDASAYEAIHGAFIDRVELDGGL